MTIFVPKYCILRHKLLGVKKQYSSQHSARLQKETNLPLNEYSFHFFGEQEIGLTSVAFLKERALSFFGGVL